MFPEIKWICFCRVLQINLSNISLRRSNTLCCQQVQTPKAPQEQLTSNNELISGWCEKL